MIHHLRFTNLKVMRSHHNLDDWKKSVDFVVLIYKMTESFQKEEKFGLTSQIRRAAVYYSGKHSRRRGKKIR